MTEQESPQFEWGINAYILQSTDEESAQPLPTGLEKLKSHLNPIENAPGAIHGYLYEQCEAAGFTLRGSIFNQFSELIERLKSHHPDEGPIAVMAVLSQVQDFLAALALSCWLGGQLDLIPDHAVPRIILCTGESIHPRLLEQIRSHYPIHGVLRISADEGCRYEGEKAVVADWEAPPPPPGPDLTEEQLLCVEASATLATFRKEQQIPAEVTLSGWIPDVDEGAKLIFHQTNNGVAPMDLQGTAMMFFAMEEMGQVSSAQYNFAMQDGSTANVSVRTREAGRLVGLFLIVGKGAAKTSPDEAVKTAKAVSDAFRACAK